MKASPVSIAEAAPIFSLLGNPTRLRLLKDLAVHREMTVTALSKVAGLNIANISLHLKLLKLAGVLTSRQEGRSTCYSLGSELVRDLLAAVKDDALEKSVKEPETPPDTDEPTLWGSPH